MAGDWKRNWVAVIGSFIVLSVVSITQAAELAGQVIDADGQPVAGAQILSDGMLLPQTVSKGNGRFFLEYLPAGFVTIVALHAEKGVGTIRPLSGGMDVTLPLRPFSPPFTQDRQRAAKILAELVAWSAGDEILHLNVPWHVWVPYDLKRAEEQSRRPDGTLPGHFIVMAMAQLGKTDPQAAAEWGLPRLDSIESVLLRNQAMLMLGLQIAESDPALANDLFERAALFIDEEEVPISREQLLELAFHLKRPETQELLRDMLQQAKEEDAEDEEEDEERGTYSAQVSLVSLVAKYDMPLAESLLKDLDVAQQVEVQRNMIRFLVRKKEEVNLDKAHRLLESLAKNETASARTFFARAAIDIILMEGQTNPAAALQLARRVGELEFQAEALAAAAQFQDEATAAMLLREAATVAMRQHAPLGQIVNIALLATPKFPDLGRELTEQAIRLWNEQSPRQREATLAEGAGNFVALLAMRDKLTARALLELEWGRILPEGTKASKANLLVLLSHSMASLDFERALEMARSIPLQNGIDEDEETGFNFARFRAEQGLARRLLLGPQNWQDWRGYSWNYSK